MSQTISVAEYFERVVPDQFATTLADAPADVHSQPELTTTYEITGDGGGMYGIRIKDGALEIVQGGIPDSDMRSIFSVDHWQRWISDNGVDMAVDYTRRGKINVVKGIKGIVKLDLEREDGPGHESTIIFGATDAPEVVVRMTVPDYLAMMSGELNGQMAFMTGKLKFEGSLPLLMQLGALSS